MDDASTQPYEKIWVSEFFHSFPHLNRHMNRVSSEFEPDETKYRESLAFWVLIPLALCVVLWLFYFIFFICRCCEKQTQPQKTPSQCPRVLTGLLIFFGLGLLSFGLYENEEAHRGVDQFRGNVIEINTTVGSAVDRLNSLDAMASDIAGEITESILEIVDDFTDQALKIKLEHLVKDIKHQTVNAHNRLVEVDLTNEFDYLGDTIKISNDVEQYRWAGSVIISCVYIFIFFVTLVGLLIRSRTLLIISTVLCVFCMVLLWAFAGAHLGSSVGLGDFCDDPNTYIIDLPREKEEKDIVKAYVECVNNTEPYGNEIQGAIKSLTQAQIILDSMEKLLNSKQQKALNQPIADMKLDLKYSMANLSILMDNIGICTTIHNYYEHAIKGACVDTITSTALLSATICMIGICCIIMIISNSVLWRQYAKKRLPTNYNQVDDTDPFLPRPPPYDSDYGAVGYSSPTPWSERGTLQRYNTDSPYSDESLMMLPHMQTRHSAPLPVDESPPPAYHPGRFVRQYAASENR